MSALLLAASTFASTPSPTVDEVDPTSVSPGVLGFLATFAVVLVTVLLMVDMVRRVRRLRYREMLARDAERAGPEETGSKAADEEPR